MHARLSLIRPSRIQRWQKHGGWEVYEGDGVSPVYCGPNAREDPLSYARQCAGYAPTEIRARCGGNVVKLFYRNLCVASSDAQRILANRNASCQGVRDVARYWRSGKLPA